MPKGIKADPPKKGFGRAAHEDLPLRGATPARVTKPIKAKLETFIEAWFANGNNATQAALTAGAPEKSARNQGQLWLRHPYAQQLIRDYQAKTAAALEARFSLTRENVLEALSNLVFADPRKLFDEDGKLKNIVDLDDRTAKMVSSFEVFEEHDREGRLLGYTKKIKMWDKNSAVDKAMKHLGLFEKDNEQSRDTKISITPADAGVL